MTNKEKYIILCNKEKEIPVFSQPFWLDAVCGPKNWDVSLVEKNDEILATMPYFIKKKYGFKRLILPVLTQKLGPWIKYPPNQKYESKLSFEKKIFNELIGSLPKNDEFVQCFNHKYTNWLPFYWNGFKQTTRYTYLLNLEIGIENIWINFKSTVRGKIRKAEKIVSLNQKMSIESFYMINKKTFERQNIKIPYSLEFVKKKDKILVKKEKRRIFCAVDNQNNIHSALYLIWDSNTAYVHMVGEDPNFRNSGAGIFLIWEAIKYSKEELNLSFFDFEGSMIENVEEVRRSCGGIQTPYFQISKVSSKRLKFIYFFRSFIN